MKKLLVKDLDLKGKRVLIRVDFNVPLNKKGEITDDARIQAALPTIRYCLEKGASLVLMSHLGRPEGRVDLKYSLSPVAKRLEELLKQPVGFVSECVGPEVEKKVDALEPKQALLLENLRFHPGEEEPEKEAGFVEALARLGDVYVNDAFGTAHRAHASTTFVARHFPGHAAAGFLMEKEISHLSALLGDPDRPFYAILGGAKVSTKAGVIHNLLEQVDALFIGGAMAFTFFAAKGIPMGASLVEKGEMQRALEISEKSGVHLPLDFRIAQKIEEGAESKVVSAEEGIPDGWEGVDIGPKTVEEWSKLLAKAATVFWNGPLGVFEVPPFDRGTEAVARFLAEGKAQVVIGGGDSVAAVQKMGMGEKFAHLSTGGGASLEFLEFGHLPGVDALSNGEYTETT